MRAAPTQSGGRTLSTACSAVDASAADPAQVYCCERSMGGGGNTTLVLKNNAFAQRTGNPHHGFMHFDNILWAFLVIFQVRATQETALHRLHFTRIEVPRALRHAGDIPRRRSCLLYTSPSPRDGLLSRMPSSA